MTAMSMQPGDILWTIAQRFYGSGEQEARRFVANDGRAQPDGTALTRYGVIYPGWVLRLPEATRVVRVRRRSGEND
jgi:nucleoid-associated protein YgaU